MLENVQTFLQWADDMADPRTKNWFLISSPWPVVAIFVLYLLSVRYGPRLMSQRAPLDMKYFIIIYNLALVAMSIYMFYEMLVVAVMSNYSLKCQPIDFSTKPLPMRMAGAIWWFFFSKIIEILDTVFFILRKKDRQLTFLHVYHHCTMIINAWLGVRYIAGGQIAGQECILTSGGDRGDNNELPVFFAWVPVPVILRVTQYNRDRNPAFMVGMLNSFVHIFMYAYYGLAAFGPHMQKYLWWKRYLTRLQLTQFFAFLLHTGYNITTDCDFPRGFNIAVFLHAFSLVILFGNFYYRNYTQKPKSISKTE